jgi:sulfoxide reductase heme-binding subunit YedZ
MSGSGTSVSEHLFWIISRGAGTTALVLSSVAVCFGLAMAGRIGGGDPTERRAYHEVLSLSVMVAIAVHGLALLGDSLLHPSLLDISVPFALGYERIATTLGIIAGWAFVCLGLSFYVRDRIGRSRWKVIHRFTLLAWAMGLAHTLIEGTDAGQLWYLALVAVTSAPVILLLAERVVRSGFGHRLDSVGSRPARPVSSVPGSTPSPRLW